jgi:glycosyltransferase involved in cell wall biosynthesis
VIIGRNEGERLVRCIQSALPQSDAVVYVDSGSSDGSVERARELGARVVELDRGVPFSASRARNAGFAALREIGQLDCVQFVDGDCEILEGWIAAGSGFLSENENFAAVCGRLRERNPDASIYNQICDVEWSVKSGESEACGGVAMYRVSSLEAVGGFDASVAAGEERELCGRLRAKGWKVMRLDAPMATHDAAMTKCSQWWKREIRGGYGGLDVATRFENGNGNFTRQIRSARIWGIGLPVAALAAGITAGAVGGLRIAILAAAVILSAWFLQVIRIAARTKKRGRKAGFSLAYGLLLMLAKWAQLIGQARYILDRRKGQQPRLIEHKAPAIAGGGR